MYEDLRTDSRMGQGLSRKVNQLSRTDHVGN